jgi:hypothetical protein
LGPQLVFAEPFWPLTHPADFEAHSDRIADDAMAFILAPGGRLADALGALEAMEFSPVEVCPVEVVDWDQEHDPWEAGGFVGSVGVVVVGYRGDAPWPTSPLTAPIRGADPSAAVLEAVALAYGGIEVVDLLASSDAVSAEA